MSYTSKLNLCLSPATSLGGSDASAAKALPTRRLTDRLNFALAGYGLLAGGSVSAAGPGVITTSTIGKSTQLIMSAVKSTSITIELAGG
jgi:hypothetical protein